MGDRFIDEHTLLLPEDPSSTTKEDGAPFKIIDDLTGLARQMIPIFFSFALQNAVQAVCVLTAGSLGPFELGVASFGFMFFGATGTMVAIGGTTALDTLCGQAWTSHVVTENPKILGLLLQQCLLVLLAIFAFVTVPIWVFSGPLFVQLGQQPDFAYATAKFLWFMIPAGVFQIVAECLKKFVQVQGESNIVGLSTAIASIIGVLVDFVLVRMTSLKLWGVPIAFCVYQLCIAASLLLIIAIKPAIRKTWYGSIAGTWNGISRLIFYALTGILTTATEWWR